MADRLERPFATLRLSFPAEFVLHVEFARTKQLNTMNRQFFIDMMEAFMAVRAAGTVRAVVISAEPASKLFTAGLDFKEIDSFPQRAEDPAREALKFLPYIAAVQTAITAIETCNKPVIAAVHGACVGGGLDLITACDIRLCSKDATFSVKEVDIGIAADLGTLQRMPRVCGNQSWIRDVCLTGRMLPSSEALQFGLVSRVLEDKTALFAEALQIATIIASKSPIASYSIKHILNHARDHTVQDGLDYVGLWNSVMMNSPDTINAAQSSIAKKKPIFPKL